MMKEMNMLDEVKLVADKIDQLHMNDPRICEYWDELAEILVRDEAATISLLNGLADTELIKDISSVFEEISWGLQSQDFIRCIEALDEKHPELLLGSMVRAAKNTMPD